MSTIGNGQEAGLPVPSNRLPPLRPDTDPWVGLDVKTETVRRFFQLDTPRYVATGAFAVIAYAIYSSANWIPYASTLVVVLATLIAHLKGGGNDGTPSVDSNKDPPKPRGYLDGS